jgi:hypothetical protein
LHHREDYQIGFYKKYRKINKMKKIASRGYSMPQPKGVYIHKLMELVNTSPYPQHLRMQLTSISVDHAMVKLKTEQCQMAMPGKGIRWGAKKFLDQ